MIKKNLGSKKIEFKISAPRANKVAIAGDFNGWKPDVLTAKKDKEGLWKASATIPAGTYEYKFVIDGSWITDPICSKKRTNAFGTENSILEVR